jgi:hypothetical protein
MNKKGSTIIIVIAVVVALLVIGAVWYYYASQGSAVTPTASTQGAASATTPTTTTQHTVDLPAFSFSCPRSATTTLTAYDNPAMGIAFCYPSDVVVTTNTITWSASGTQGSQLSFWILHDATARNIAGPESGESVLFYDLAGCLSSGPHGEDWCAPPSSTAQIVEGKNSNGFNYVLFRHNIDFSSQGEGYGATVYQSAVGPSAFIPLIGQNYFAFALVNSLYQGTGFGSLPSNVDKDLLEILDTVSIMPEQYTGVGLTLTSNASGPLSIYNVIANSPAAAAGIKAGNIITQINGSSTTNMSVDAATNILDSATGTVMVGIQEGGSQQPTTISLTPATFAVSGPDLGSIYQKPF